MYGYVGLFGEDAAAAGSYSADDVVAEPVGCCDVWSGGWT